MDSAWLWQAGRTEFRMETKSTGRKPIAGILLYWLLFFAAIVFWEVVMGCLSLGAPDKLNYWFLLFALPQSLVFAALCGWKGDRFNKILFAVLMLILYSFYLAELIFFRAFGSMISLTMIGVGGDAVTDFGWAMMDTVKDSVGLIILLTVPVIASVVWIFRKKPEAGIVRLWIRPLALIAAAGLWFMAGPILRLGGTQEASAYQAYVSSLVDADTSAARIGVLTTTILDYKTSHAGEEYDREISDTVSAVVSDVSDESAEALSEAETAADLSFDPGSEADLAMEPEDEEETGTEEEFSPDPGSEVDLAMDPDDEGEAGTAEEPLPLQDPEPAGEAVFAVSEPEEGSDPVTAEASERPFNTLPEIDFDYLASVAGKDSQRKLCKYFATVPGTRQNEYTGMLEGYNLVYICAEAFCSYAVDEQITPTLYKLANEGIVLTNFYNSFKNTTTNGEFALMTGLWPDVSRKADCGVTTGSFGQSAKNLMPYGLGNVFKPLGVRSFAFHNYLGSYYGRARTHKNLGYKCKFRGAMHFSNTWPASDLQMMKQSVDDFINEDRFNAYYMTFSGHGPYRANTNQISSKNLKKVPKTLNGRKLDSVARCYFSNNIELDSALKYLMQRLEEAGKLDKTLIVMAGDHYPYYLTDAAAKSILGRLPDKAFERYHSTCIMWFASEEPIVCDVPCCNVDVLPTVLNLLGIPYDSRLLSGTDVFSDSPHYAMLYNKSFITDLVKYNASTGKATWLDGADSLTSEEKQEMLDTIIKTLKARYAAALSINKIDFYRFVWKKSFSAKQEGKPSAGTAPEITPGAGGGSEAASPENGTAQPGQASPNSADPGKGDTPGSGAVIVGRKW